MRLTVINLPALLLPLATSWWTHPRPLPPTPLRAARSSNVLLADYNRGEDGGEEVDEAAVMELIETREALRYERQFDEADAVRETLRANFNVELTERGCVADPSHGHKRFAIPAHQGPGQAG